MYINNPKKAKKWLGTWNSGGQVAAATLTLFGLNTLEISKPTFIVKRVVRRYFFPFWASFTQILQALYNSCNHFLVSRSSFCKVAGNPVPPLFEGLMNIVQSLGG